MSRKFVSVVCAVTLLAGLSVTGLRTEASDVPAIDGSKLTYETESTGTALQTTRGLDLQFGYSKIVNGGPGKVHAGGSTLAAREVETVKIAVMVERAKWEDTEWEFVDGWQKENKNFDSVSTSKTLSVEGDYYYRVRSIHSAGNDMSSSVTNGIHIDKP